MFNLASVQQLHGNRVVVSRQVYDVNGQLVMLAV